MADLYDQADMDNFALLMLDVDSAATSTAFAMRDARSREPTHPPLPLATEAQAPQTTAAGRGCRARQACDRCRRLRERCIAWPDAAGHGTCAGCHARNLACTFDMPWYQRASKRSAADAQLAATPKEDSHVIKRPRLAAPSAVDQRVGSLSVSYALLDLFEEHAFFVPPQCRAQGTRLVALGESGAIPDDFRLKLVAMALCANRGVDNADAPLAESLRTEARMLTASCVGRQSADSSLAFLLLHMHFLGRDNDRARMYLALCSTARPRDAQQIETESVRVQVRLGYELADDADVDDGNALTRLSEADLVTKPVHELLMILTTATPTYICVLSSPMLPLSHPAAALERRMLVDFRSFILGREAAEAAMAALDSPLTPSPRLDEEMHLLSLVYRHALPRWTTRGPRGRLFVGPLDVRELHSLWHVTEAKYGLARGDPDAALGWLAATRALWVEVLSMPRATREIAHNSSVPMLMVVAHAAALCGDHSLAYQAIAVLDSMSTWLGEVLLDNARALVSKLLVAPFTWQAGQ